jgi:hypothetical protein
MLLGHVSSGRFSGSPGRNKILSLFFTSSIRSLAALESSNRSFLMINFGGSLLLLYGVWCEGRTENDELPLRENTPFSELPLSVAVGVGELDSEWL